MKSKVFPKLRRVWRWMRGDVAITNADLPKALLEQMEGPFPSKDFVSNGNSFSPDRLFGCDLRPAGHLHDFGYSLVRNEEERKEIDYFYIRNLRKCGLGWFLSRKYFYRVRPWGACICKYSGFEGQRPRGWQWLKLFATRYFEW